MRQVNPWPLWIGNAREARAARAICNAGFAAVIDLAEEEPLAVLPRDLVYCRWPLQDGADNPLSRIRTIVAMIVGLVASSEKTLIACSAGMSRSPAIAAAVLSQLEQISIEAALIRIGDCGPCDISPALYHDLLQAMN